MKTLAGSIVLFTVLVSAASAAEFHKWKDENGVWHYSETPPENHASTAVEVNTFQPALPPAAAPASPGVTTASTTAATETASNTPSAPAATLPAPTAEPGAAPRRGGRDRKANCERTRLNVATLETYAQVTLDRNNDGVPETLSESEHLAELEKARAQMKVFCAPN